MSFDSPITRDTAAGPSGPAAPSAFRIGPVTAVLIGLSVLITYLTELGMNDPMLFRLLISRESDGGLPEIRNGEVWRLITPIFIHFSLPHIAFNMLWLKDLGTMIEARSGSGRLIGLVLATGLAGNLAQYWFSSPVFGGMSGVVYGLLGYIWMKARLEPDSGFRLERQTVIMMIVWLVVCMAGLVGRIANYAHGFGFAVGLAWGALEAGLSRARR